MNCSKRGCIGPPRRVLRIPGKPRKHWLLAQPGRALAWGARGRQFKSARPDHSILSNLKTLQTLVRKSQRRAGKFESRLLGRPIFNRSRVFRDLRSQLLSTFELDQCSCLCNLGYHSDLSRSGEESKNEAMRLPAHRAKSFLMHLIVVALVSTTWQCHAALAQKKLAEQFWLAGRYDGNRVIVYFDAVQFHGTVPHTARRIADPAVGGFFM